MARIEDLVKELDEIKYRIKQIKFHIKELKETYLPGHGLSIGHGGGSSPQEVIVSKIDALEREVAELQLRAIEINEIIYKRLEELDNPKARWIVTQRIKGRTWNEIDCEGLSASYMKTLYKQAIEVLNGGGYDR